MREAPDCPGALCGDAGPPNYFAGAVLAGAGTAWVEAAGLLVFLCLRCFFALPCVAVCPAAGAAGAAGLGAF